MSVGRVTLSQEKITYRESHLRAESSTARLADVRATKSCTFKGRRQTSVVASNSKGCLENWERTSDREQGSCGLHSLEGIHLGKHRVLRDGT